MAWNELLKKKLGLVVLAKDFKPALVRHALLNCVEFAGIHIDSSLRFGGNRISKLDVRSDDRTSRTSGLSDCRSCSPHSLLRSGRIWFIQPLIQSNFKRAWRTRSGCPDAECAGLFFIVVRATVPEIMASVLGFDLLCRGSDGPGRKALNER